MCLGYQKIMGRTEDGKVRNESSKRQQVIIDFYVGKIRFAVPTAGFGASADHTR